MTCRLSCLGLLVLLATGFVGLPAAEPRPVPVILDTDIGTDIDDAYALALIIHSPELRLIGVTTVSGDAVARARLAAKLLNTAGGAWTEVPVYAGISNASQYAKQNDWANGFASPALHESGGVDFMRRTIDAHPGEITLIALGELTNLAALLDSEPGIGAKIKAVALMGGSVRRGYAAGSAPEPEWNIKSNIAAARTVFSSGVPLLVAPLDSTIALRLEPALRVNIFARSTPLTDALAALDFVWLHTNPWHGDLPVLYDPLAVALVSTPQLVQLTPMHLEVLPDGMTRPVDGRPANAQVALVADPAVFLQDFTTRLCR